MKPDHRFVKEWVALGVLVTLGTVGRIICDSFPNVAPVAAVALLAGFLFRSWFLAALVPILVMGISDVFIGRSEWTTQVAVYCMLVAPVFARGYLRRRLRFAGRPWSCAVRNAWLGIPPAIVFAVSFFVVTNFACWLAWYPHTWAGLSRCYLLALPMFRGTLLGDVSFTIVLFGGYTLLRCLAASWASRPTLEQTT